MRSAERTLENRWEISSTDRPRHRVRIELDSSPGSQGASGADLGTS
jgi:hypothetical protein